MGEPRKCLNCEKSGAASFNKLCSTCWQAVIDRNIKNIVDKIKKEQF